MSLFGLNRKVVCALIASFTVIAAAYGSQVNAATPTTTFDVQVTILDSCTVSTDRSLDFSRVEVLAQRQIATSMLMVQCTETTPYNIGVKDHVTICGEVLSQNATDSRGIVYFSFGSDTNTPAGGGGSSEPNAVASAGIGSVQLFTLFGHISPQTAAAPCDYPGTVIVTVTY